MQWIKNIEIRLLCSKKWLNLQKENSALLFFVQILAKLTFICLNVNNLFIFDCLNSNRNRKIDY